MDTKFLLLQGIEQDPKPILETVLDFLGFLRAKQEKEKLEIQADLKDTRAALGESQQYDPTPLAHLKLELGLFNH